LSGSVINTPTLAVFNELNELVASATELFTPWDLDVPAPLSLEQIAAMKGTNDLATSLGLPTVPVPEFRSNQDLLEDALSGPDQIIGNSFADTINAGTGNDTITGGPGDDVIIGGAGDDLAIFSNLKSNTSVSLRSDGIVSVQDRNGSGGLDALFQVETFQFADYNLKISDYSSLANLTSSQFSGLAKVYVAYFNRAADAEGLYFWADKLAEGMDMATIANNFSKSAEAQALYPNTADTSAFVTAVYANVLGRTSDVAGFEFWTTALNNGTMQPATFVLSIIGGAQGADITYLSNKANLGVYFSAIKGMSDVADAQNVLSIFGDQATSNTAGAKASADGHFTDATASGGSEFLFNLVGIVDNPFSDVA